MVERIMNYFLVVVVFGFLGSMIGLIAGGFGGRWETGCIFGLLAGCFLALGFIFYPWRK